MMNEAGIQNLKERYSHIHPLIFQRSIQLSSNLGELYDILEDIPNKYPLIWDRKQKKWLVVEDILKINAE